MSERDDRAWSDLTEGWRADPADAERLAAIEPADVRARAAKFSRKVRHRNLGEVVAGVIVCGYGAVLMATASEPLRLWAGLTTIAGALIVCVILLVRGGNLDPPPPTASTSAVLDFERAQLLRQAALLERVWLWYLGPLVPGLSLSLASSWVEAARAGRPTWPIVPMAAACVALFVLLGWLNGREARKLRDKATRLGNPG